MPENYKYTLLYLASTGYESDKYLYLYCINYKCKCNYSVNSFPAIIILTISLKTHFLYTQTYQINKKDNIFLRVA